MSALRRTCKEVVHLTLLGLDVQLPLNDRIAMRFHLWACKACPRFARQVALMQKASARWRRYSETEN
ncbi:MAG TPA: zf-HC2 domain-containing protein [Burkholderiaceae bacterium]